MADAAELDLTDAPPRKQEVTVHDHAPFPEERSTDPMAMIDRALAANASPDMLEKLMTLQERWEKNRARAAFDEAMAAAKAEIPVIAKNREVDFTSTKGRTHYRHEDLAGIASVVDPILARHGLSYRFRTTSPPNEPVTVTCIVSHRGGHAEENTLSAGRDDSGNKNSIQAVGSTITYLQRYTLKAALGLAAGQDDDGKAAGAGAPITAEQVEDLQQRIVEADANIADFLKFFGIESIPSLPADQYDKAVRMLTVKKAKAAKEKEPAS